MSLAELYKFDLFASFTVSADIFFNGARVIIHINGQIKS